MISRYQLSHCAAGLLDKFMGRKNDYESHWALGVLYMEARAAGNRVELDLLAASAQPASAACASQARTWAYGLRQALERHGARTDDLSGAHLVIDFGLPPLAQPPGFNETGDPFLCTLRLVAREGRVAERCRMDLCVPADEFWNGWSGPYVKPAL